MALPLIPLMLGGAAIGAATAGKDKKKGALKGALLGLTLGGASALPGALGAKGATAATTTGGTKLASSKALTDAMAAGKAAAVPVVESTSAAALKAGAPTTAAKTQAVNQLNNIALQQQQRGILDAVAQSGGQMSLTPESIAALQQGTTASGAFSPIANSSAALNAYNASALPGNKLTAATLDKTLQKSAESLAAAEPAGIGTKLLTTVKEKPLETAFMMSMLGGGGGGGGYAVSGGGGPTYGGQQQVQPYASAEDRLIAAGGKSDGTPEFIPKGDFDTRQALKEEEYLRMMNRGMI